MNRLSRLADEDLRMLLLIRHAEWRVQRLFADGQVAGTTHTCLGQEYIPVALRPLLREADFVFSNHRGHGHYLSRTGDLAGLFAEILGRVGAPCHGVGGSQQLRRSRYLSTGVLGQSMPPAAGVALHLKRSGHPALTCVYLGDGAWGEGVVYESLNLAGLWRLPLLVVVEHNGIAQTTPTDQQLAGTIADRARAFGLAYTGTASTDVNEIRESVAGLIADVRTSHRPVVAEFVTHRLGPHSKGDDTRPAAVRREAERHDWYPRYRDAFPDHLAAFDEPVRRQVERVAEEVVSRPPAVWEG